MRAPTSRRRSPWRRKAVALGPRKDLLPLAHFVLADLYNRVGRPQDAAREVSQGRAAEASANRGR